MKNSLQALVFVALLIGAGPPPGDDPLRRPGDELVQSELDYLEARDLPITLAFKDAPLSTVFKALGQAATLKVELRGEIPSDARATFRWNKVTLKDVLTQLAQAFALSYKAEGGRKLVVIMPRKQ